MEKPFTPDWGSAPGETMIDCLKERKLSILKFQELMGVSAKEVDDIITGETIITPVIALKLSEVLGGSVAFWLNREAGYQEYLCFMVNNYMINNE